MKKINNKILKCQDNENEIEIIEWQQQHQHTKRKEEREENIAAVIITLHEIYNAHSNQTVSVRPCAIALWITFNKNEFIYTYLYDKYDKK